MLEMLWLNENPVTKKKGYRMSTVSLLSSALILLDGERLSTGEKETNMNSSAIRDFEAPPIHVNTLASSPLPPERKRRGSYFERLMYN